MRYTFEEVKLTATRSVVGSDGKKRRQQKTFSQTLNPFNLNADGTVKSRADIRRELDAEAGRWKASGNG